MSFFGFLYIFGRHTKKDYKGILKQIKNETKKLFLVKNTKFISRPVEDFY